MNRATDDQYRTAKTALMRHACVHSVTYTAESGGERRLRVSVDTERIPPQVLGVLYHNDIGVEDTEPQGQYLQAMCV